MSLRELAEKSGVSKSTLIRFEAGKQPGMLCAAAIETVFNVGGVGFGAGSEDRFVRAPHRG